MNITDNTVVTIDYTLTNNDNDILDRSENGQFCYLHGANNIISGLESALLGKSQGDQLNVAIQPEQGYGERDESMLQTVKRAMFGTDQDIKVGTQFHAESPQGEAMAVTVTKIEGDDITIDGNHPMAGIPLNFDVTIIEIRTATQDEISHGHAHGPNDKHHH